MTSEAFITAIQTYYDQCYSKGQTKYVKDWLDGKSDHWRETLFRVTLERHQGYSVKGDKVLPNIAVFEGLAGQVRGRL